MESEIKMLLILMEKKGKDKALENVLDALAVKVRIAPTHTKRKEINQTAYGVIRELHSDSKKIKYWDDYYQTAKYNEQRR